MIKVRDIEKAVSCLPSKDLAEFRSWFQKFDALRWDRQFEADAKGGKLDSLARTALADFKKGKYKKL